MILQPEHRDEQPDSDEMYSRNLRLVKDGEQHKQASDGYAKLRILRETIGLSLLELWIPLSGYKNKKSYDLGSDYGHEATISDIGWYLNPIALLEHALHADIQKLPCHDEERYYKLLEHILYMLPDNLMVQQAMRENRDSEGRHIDAIGAVPFIVDNDSLESVVVQAVSEYCGRQCSNRMHCYLAADHVPEFRNPDGAKLDSSVFFS